MKDYYTISIERFNIRWDVKYDWFIYLPFIGWMYPFALRKNDDFSMFHARQGLIMALFFTLVPMTLTFATVFIPISFRGLKLAIDILVWVSHLLYFSLCLFGTVQVVKGKTRDIPVVSSQTHKIGV